jgi:hypothetical protein
MRVILFWHRCWTKNRASLSARPFYLLFHLSRKLLLLSAPTAASGKCGFPSLTRFEAKTTCSVETLPYSLYSQEAPWMSVVLAVEANFPVEKENWWKLLTYQHRDWLAEFVLRCLGGLIGFDWSDNDKSGRALYLRRRDSWFERRRPEFSRCLSCPIARNTSISRPF